MEKYLLSISLSLSLLSSLSAGQLLAVPAYTGPHHRNDAMGPLLFDLIETAILVTNIDNLVGGNKPEQSKVYLDWGRYYHPGPPSFKKPSYDHHCRHYGRYNRNR